MKSSRISLKLVYVPVLCFRLNASFRKGFIFLSFFFSFCISVWFVDWFRVVILKKCEMDCTLSTFQFYWILIEATKGPKQNIYLSSNEGVGFPVLKL